MEKQKTRSRKTGFFTFLRICLLILVSVGWIILQSFLGSENTSNSYIFTVFIVIFFVFTVFFLISFFAVLLLRVLNTTFTKAIEKDRCQYFNTICCVNLAIDSLKSAYRIRLDDSVATKYGLYSEEQLIEKEGNINQGEVWIVSYDLTAEAQENHKTQVREMNIKKGVKYRLFYINDNAEKYGELQDNIKLLDARYNKKMKLYPYEKPISIFSFLFSLFGIIMLTDKEGLVKEAFFTLYSSNDKIKEPIYIKMSYCMERKYNKILYSIMKSARNPRDKNYNNNFSKNPRISQKRNIKDFMSKMRKKKKDTSYFSF